MTYRLADEVSRQVVEQRVRGAILYGIRHLLEILLKQVGQVEALESDTASSDRCFDQGLRRGLSERVNLNRNRATINLTVRSQRKEEFPHLLQSGGRLSRSSGESLANSL